MPAWKAAYRLDLARERPFLQGWAIVDNNTDDDWADAELSLVIGKPVSFTQNLYAPCYPERPELPLSLPGLAEARTHEPGAPPRPAAVLGQMISAPLAHGPKRKMSRLSEIDSLEDTGFAVEEGTADAAVGHDAGGGFEFTFKTPVCLPRRQSAMLPLAECALRAEKTLVFSGAGVPGRAAHPFVSAVITNDSGMKLPAGPVTVYDGGIYAGDTLLEFFPKDEKRIISYGEDLAVSGSFADGVNRISRVVSVGDGKMLARRTVIYERVYTFINASGEPKRLIIEHPFRSGRACLRLPLEYSEKTSGLYRFDTTLPPGSSSFEVREEELTGHDIILSSFGSDDFAAYTASEDVPAPVKDGLRAAAELLRDTRDKTEKLEELRRKLGNLHGDQERTRKNLAAAGTHTQQAHGYLTRLAQLDSGIDALQGEIAAAEETEKTAMRAYQDFLRGLYFNEVP
jgi:hypothetical protein